MKALWVAVACALFSSAAWADAESDALVDEGVNKRAAGEDAAALALFQRAYQREKAPRTLAQIALAEQALARWLDAHRHLSAALGSANDTWIKSNRPTLQGALKAIRAKLGELVLSSPTDGATARVAGADAVALPATVLVEAGKVRVEVRASGYLSATKSIEVAAGGRATASIGLVKPAARAPEPARVEATPEPAPEPQPERAPPLASPPPADSGRTDLAMSPAPTGGPDNTLAWIVGGAGAGTALIGVILIAAAEPSDFDCTFDEFGEFSCANPGQSAGIALLVTGLLLGGTSGVLFAISGDDDGGATASAAALSGCGVGLRSVSCAWRF